ncbi:MAG: hypothetical protein ABII07_00330 [Patescibacteria group bacterium]
MSNNYLKALAVAELLREGDPNLSEKENRIRSATLAIYISRNRTRLKGYNRSRGPIETPKTIEPNFQIIAKPEKPQKLPLVEIIQDLIKPEPEISRQSSGVSIKIRGITTINREEFISKLKQAFSDLTNIGPTNYSNDPAKFHKKYYRIKFDDLAPILEQLNAKPYATNIKYMSAHVFVQFGKGNHVSSFSIIFSKDS